jgi:hypothetical protein
MNFRLSLEQLLFVSALANTFHFTPEGTIECGSGQPFVRYMRAHRMILVRLDLDYDRYNAFIEELSRRCGGKEVTRLSRHSRHASKEGPLDRQNWMDMPKRGGNVSLIIANHSFIDLVVTLFPDCLEETSQESGQDISAEADDALAEIAA